MAETIITIYGPGLLGGSLALAIQERMTNAKIRFWARRESAKKGILEAGIKADFFIDPVEAANGANLIVLCTPVETMPELAEKIAAAQFPPDYIITDVGSVKGSVVRPLTRILGHRFIGSHPMAGSEKTGIKEARADLFVNAACIVTPTSRTRRSNLTRLTNFWEIVGCHVVEMTSIEHDRKVARISHMPHMIAAITSLSALQEDITSIKIAAGGFRDTTRIASGDPGLWTGIAKGNRSELIRSLKDAKFTIIKLINALVHNNDDELAKLLWDAKNLRDIFQDSLSRRSLTSKKRLKNSKIQNQEKIVWK